jgi:hypothetical protein
VPSLWFCVPVFGRIELASICLRQLRRTCDALIEAGVDASAVVVGDEMDLAELRPDELGFGEVERDNAFTSAKFNDAIQLATDPEYNPRPADYVVPCGSDDWVDWRLFVKLPKPDTIIGFQRVGFVREDGREISTHHISYPGGAGIRIYPQEIVAAIGHRPADEDRRRGCDTSILTNVRRVLRHEVHVHHRYLHDFQIVDWKTEGEQLNTLAYVSRHFRPLAVADPFEVLRGVYPDEALEDMQRHYAREAVAV